MRKNILKIALIVSLMTFVFSMQAFAGRLDPGISLVSSVQLSDDGDVSFNPPSNVYNDGVRISDKWKRFDVQLLKRVTTLGNDGRYRYTYKTHGSVQYVSADERECNFNFTSVGYYEVQIRGEDLEGNYGYWFRESGAIYNGSNWVPDPTNPDRDPLPGQTNPDDYWEGVAIDENQISPGGGGGGNTGGGNNDANYGPGVISTATIPNGYQYAVIGPNGEILYYYGGNQTNYGNYYNTGQYNMSGNPTTYGPGYVQNGINQQAVVPNTGISSYPQVQSPYIQGNNVIGNNGVGNNANTNPNYYNGNVVGNGATPQINGNTQIGFNVDNVGRFYYQGNGNVLKSTWYLIDGNYYRFSDNGYALCNTWFKDPGSGAWYYLAADGKMLTGWQKIQGSWYYFKPENGNGYGACYINTTAQINDSSWGSGSYAFDANGVCVMNAWFNGGYYGSDGKRTS